MKFFNTCCLALYLFLLAPLVRADTSPTNPYFNSRGSESANPSQIIDRSDPTISHTDTTEPVGPYLLLAGVFVAATAAFIYGLKSADHPHHHRHA